MGWSIFGTRLRAVRAKTTSSSSALWSSSRCARSFASSASSSAASAVSQQLTLPPELPELPSILQPNVNFSRFLSPMHQATIVGAPLADGQPLVGVDLGPSHIRSGGLIQRLQKDHWTVRDLGDLHFPSTATHPSLPTSSLVRSAGVVGGSCEMLFHALLPAARSHQFCLTLGGDHSVAIGSISSILLERPESAIVWVDAHADINTPSTSHSKNIHGMAVAFLMNLEKTREIPGFEWMKPVPLLRPERLVYVGLRDLDAGEKHILRALNIKAFTMYDVDRHGIAKVMEMAMDHVVGRVPRPVHLSLDIDSIDPAFAPSTGTRVAGGLSYREAYFVSEYVAESGCMSSMDLVEVNPSLSSPEGTAMTVQMACGLISSAMGNRIL